MWCISPLSPSQGRICSTFQWPNSDLFFPAFWLNSSPWTQVAPARVESHMWTECTIYYLFHGSCYISVGVQLAVQAQNNSFTQIRFCASLKTLPAPIICSFSFWSASTSPIQLQPSHQGRCSGPCSCVLTRVQSKMLFIFSPPPGTPSSPNPACLSFCWLAAKLSASTQVVSTVSNV